MAGSNAAYIKLRLSSALQNVLVDASNLVLRVNLFDGVYDLAVCLPQTAATLATMHTTDQCLSPAIIMLQTPSSSTFNFDMGTQAPHHPSIFRQQASSVNLYRARCCFKGNQQAFPPMALIRAFPALLPFSQFPSPSASTPTTPFSIIHSPYPDSRPSLQGVNKDLTIKSSAQQATSTQHAFQFSLAHVFPSSTASESLCCT
ncbi:hypothetical protein F5Y18DRAFT_152054 [Xylariaceae sp. FL1019]|nr:hypothetical protein F5Y18DRAFT_152054 [Xylariaceae sp. FL1019]